MEVLDLGRALTDSTTSTGIVEALKQGALPRLKSLNLASCKMGAQHGHLLAQVGRYIYIIYIILEGGGSTTLLWQIALIRQQVLSLHYYMAME